MIEKPTTYNLQLTTKFGMQNRGYKERGTGVSLFLLDKNFNVTTSNFNGVNTKESFEMKKAPPLKEYTILLKRRGGRGHGVLLSLR